MWLACVQVAWETPGGLRAGLLNTFSTVVDQDVVDRIESPAWRRLLFAICFLHTAVQERRRFGPISWSVPYEFSLADLTVKFPSIARML